MLKFCKRNVIIFVILVGFFTAWVVDIKYKKESSLTNIKPIKSISKLEIESFEVDMYILEETIEEAKEKLQEAKDIYNSIQTNYPIIMQRGQ